MPLTVEQLNDVVQSQMCLHGNHKVFFHPELLDAPEFFELFAGEDSILDCMSHDDSCSGHCGLEIIGERLSQMNGSAIVRASDNAPINAGFRIGFNTKEDGFVEVLNSKMLIKQTIVMEG